MDVNVWNKTVWNSIGGLLFRQKSIDFGGMAHHFFGEIGNQRYFIHSMPSGRWRITVQVESWRFSLKEMPKNTAIYNINIIYSVKTSRS